MSLYSSKKIREDKKKGDAIHIFKNNKTFDKYVLQLSKELAFYLDIETNIIIYKIEAVVKLHYTGWPRRENSFLYPNCIIYITNRGIKIFDAAFSYYLFRFYSIEL